MIHFVEQAFLFLGAGLGLVIVVALWVLLIIIVFQEIKNIFKPAKDEQPDIGDWVDYE